MIIKTQSAVLIGIETQLVKVELSVRYKQTHKFSIVGMGDKSIQESRKRIIAALHTVGIDLEQQDIMVNLAPAHIKKVGSHFDLAILVALLTYYKIVSFTSEYLSKAIFLGELSFDGHINPVQGVMAIGLDCPKLGIKRLIVPLDNIKDKSDHVETIGVSTVKDLIAYATKKDWKPQESPPVSESLVSYSDFKDIKGQRLAKRMLQISAAGNHNGILVGPPGSGKSMLVKALPSIMPPLTTHEMMEVNRVYSVATEVYKGMRQERPFRNPHYGISQAGMVGGGSPLRPGEISFSHNGVLFLDELTEFRRSTIESLRQPLEDRVVTISRAHGSIELPCSFLMIAAMNPCPCGNLGDNKRSCSCTPLVIYNYLKKISGPFLDRIDLQVFIQSVDISELHASTEETSSQQLYEEVTVARDMQAGRFNNREYTNNMLTPGEIQEYAKLDISCQKLLDFAFEKFDMSMRSYHKIIRVARTIADMKGMTCIQESHLKEALMYRGIEQKLLMLKKKL
jgi:magnesium chelatase family protein